MTAAAAIAQSRCHAAHRTLDDGRMLMACRAGDAIALYVLRPSGLGYRRATEDDGLDPNTLGWVPSSPKETPMAKRGRAENGADPIPETTPEPETATVALDDRITVTVEGAGAAATAQALVDQEKADPILRRTTRPLPVKLTDDELRKLGHDLAAVCDDIGAEVDHADSVKQELKARMTGRRTQLATLIRRGDELRDVEVITRANYAASTATEVRMDTGEVLAIRPLTDRERQMPLTPDVAAAAERAGAVHGESAEAEAK